MAGTIDREVGLLKVAELDGRSLHMVDFIHLALNTGCRKAELIYL